MPQLSDRRTLGPWMIAEFLMSYGSMVLINGCYFFAFKVLKATDSQSQWISAIWGLAYIFISLLGGRISEKFGPRTAAAGMCGLSILTSLAGLFLIRFPYIWVLPLIMFPFNLTCSTVWPAIESGLTRSPGRMPLSKRIALFNLTWSSAAFAATFTYTMLGSISYQLLFIVPAIASALAALALTFWAIPAHMIGTHNVPDTAAGEHELDDPKVRDRAKTLLKMALLSNPLAYVAIYALIPLMPKLAELNGVHNEAIGMVGSGWFAARSIGFALAGYLTFWHYKKSWQIGPLIILTLSFAGMLLIHDLAIFIALQILFGLSAAIVYSASLYYSMHVSSGHGGHAAFHEAVVGIGTMAGPLVGALAASGRGSVADSLPRVAVAVGALLVLGLIRILFMSAKRPAPENP